MIRSVTVGLPSGENEGGFVDRGMWRQSNLVLPVLQGVAKEIRNVFHMTSYIWRVCDLVNICGRYFMKVNAQHVRFFHVWCTRVGLKTSMKILPFLPSVLFFFVILNKDTDLYRKTANIGLDSSVGRAPVR